MGNSRIIPGYAIAPLAASVAAALVLVMQDPREISSALLPIIMWFYVAAFVLGVPACLVIRLFPARSMIIATYALAALAWAACTPVWGGTWKAPPHTAGGGASPSQPAPCENCGNSLADSPLRGTFWKLVRLSETPVQAAENQREAHLIFASHELRVSGGGGCNRVTGGFELDDDKLRLGRMAATVMASLPAWSKSSAS